jgi:hypothetical protein
MVSVPSVRHRHVALSGKRLVLHHMGKDGGRCFTYGGPDGDSVDLPGITVSVAALVGPSFDDEEVRQ